MNIAVSPKALEFHQAYKARRKMWNKQAMKPRFIEPPKVQLAERLKKRAQPVLKGYQCNFHVKAFYHHLSLGNPGIASPEVASKLNIRDIQHIVKNNKWELNGVVVEPFTFTIRDIKSHGRERRVALVRQVAMFVSKKKTDKSYPTIGYYFGGRDHTTVLHAYTKMRDAILSKRLLMNGKPFNLDRIGEI
jgi:hypothetical protein